MRRYHMMHVPFLLTKLFLVLTMASTVTAQNNRLRASVVSPRHLVSQEYYRTSDPAILGVPDAMAAIGNPLKGLSGGARWAPPPLPDSVPLSMEFYNVGLDEIMIGDNKFNWTTLEGLLAGSASRKMHVKFSVFIHWPGRPLRLPPHLRNITLYSTPSGMSPNYGDKRILKALQQFISAMGARLDGDKRVAAIGVGLLGFWGEGHTYPNLELVPPEASMNVAEWYNEAFNRTQIQARYSGINAVGKGLYDGSLFYNTLDGKSNGGVNRSWFMWPQIKAAGQQDAWKKSIMGGETRPELQATIFTSSYPAGTEYHQDFKECIDTLHISYVVHHDAFINGGYKGDQLRRARAAHAYMGYAFQVSEVAASVSTTTSLVDVNVTVKQAGVAPFYYDLSLTLECPGLPAPLTIGGVDELVEKGQSKTFLFQGIPATEACLNQISLGLESSYAYEERPILFAQGADGRVSLKLPLPTQRVTNKPPTAAPPTRAPTQRVTIKPPTAAPPTRAPTQK